MDAQDFKMPSPKRQRTESLESKEPRPVLSAPTGEVLTDIASKVEEGQHVQVTPAPQPDLVLDDQNEILDALMQHVEAEATPDPPAVEQPAPALTSLPLSTTVANPTSQSQLRDTAEQPVQVTSEQVPNTIQKDVQAIEPIAPEEQAGQEMDIEVEHTVPVPAPLTEIERAMRQVEGIPPTEAIEPVEGAGEAEWEVDSSPYESSTDSDSTDSSDDSDDDDDDADGDYAMLDPEEAARILMQGDAGSDDEGERSKTKGESSGLRTANEQMEDVPIIPNITITEDMKIEELGTVEAVVERNVLIRGKVSGEYQVLESGSLLCSKDRIVTGVVAETLGRVEEPLYTVRHATVQEIKDRGISEKGTIVYYVPEHSTFVFTQPLKAFKGSDASNFHDEEVGEEEIEFSDDEAEAEYKKQQKLKRKGLSADTGKGRGSGRGGRGGQRGGYKPSPLSSDMNGAAYGNGSLEMNYDDVEEGEESYTPLTRPTNLHEIMTSNQTTESASPSWMPPPPFSERDRGRGRGHHRGGRGQERGGRGGRGNYRGNREHNNSNQGGNPYQRNNPQTQQPQYQNPFPNPFNQGNQYPYLQTPPPPSLTPQTQAYPYSATMSPISPLPTTQFNFNSGGPMQQPYSPPFQQQQWGQQMPGGFASQFNNPAMMQFAQQFQQNQQQQQQQQQNNSWQVNQAAAAEVQRQLEEMRKAQGGGR